MGYPMAKRFHLSMPLFAEVTSLVPRPTHVSVIEGQGKCTCARVGGSGNETRKTLVTWTDLSNNGHIGGLVGESATLDTSCKAHGVSRPVCMHVATVQTGHDMLEENYDKICSENRQLNALFTRQKTREREEQEMKP